MPSWLTRLLKLLKIKVPKIVVPPVIPPVTPKEDPDSNDIPISTFTFVPGNKELHRGPEICKPIRGTTLRSTVNDSDNRLRMSKGPYYFPRNDIFTKMLSSKETPAGDLVLIGSKDVLELDGLKYRFCGWTLRTDSPSSPFIAKYEITVLRKDVTGAMRGYIATVEK